MGLVRELLHLGYLSLIVYYRGCVPSGLGSERFTSKRIYVLYDKSKGFLQVALGLHFADVLGILGVVMQSINFHFRWYKGYCS